MIAVARNISHGQAYSRYVTQKNLAVFVGANNMVTNTDLIFDTEQLSNIWEEFKEAGRDYVRRGKDVTNDIIAIEYSPTMNESENWTRDDWYQHAEELLEEIDDIQISKGKRDKNGNWILDENGKRKMFPVEKTHLSDSKWMAVLHRDSESGIYHLHITVSRYTEDNRLNNITDIAKRAAIAAENINERYGWTQAMDIRQRHIDEINGVINTIMADMPGDKFDPEYFKSRMKNSTFTDYKNRRRNYTVQFHRNAQGIIDGYSVGRGKSIFTATELGQKIKQMPVDYKTEIEDAVYRVLRSMNTPMFDWARFQQMMEAETYIGSEGKTKNYQMDFKYDSNNNIVGWSIIRDDKKFNASQIGSKLTAKKISKEYEKERQKILAASRPFVIPKLTPENADDVVRKRLGDLGINARLNLNVIDKSHSFDWHLENVARQLQLLDQTKDSTERMRIAERARISAVTARLIYNEQEWRRVQEERKAASQRTNIKPVTDILSEAARERRAAITSARETLQNWSDSHRAIFRDSEEEILGLGLAAKCIEDGKSPWLDVNMEGAAREFGNEVEGNTAHAVLRMTQLAGEILMGIAIPADVSLGGGGGGSNNDLPKKKDDEWNRFKSAFDMKPAGRGRRR